MTTARHNPKTVAVTGGAGFLGSHLCERMLTEGCTVVCLDNFQTGRRENVESLAAPDRLRIVMHDVRMRIPGDLPRFDEIYHLACPASVPRYQENRLGTLMTCSVGTQNVLERARRDGARFFQASTSEVYGDPYVHPQSESYNGNVHSIGPRACYDEGKRFAETLVSEYAAAYGVDAKIARIFNTFGPRMRQDDGRVVSNFIVQALSGQPLTIYGDGSQTRSLCFVDDMVDGILALTRSSVDAQTPVNLGNPEERSVREIAMLVRTLTHSEAPLIERPLPVHDPRRRRPDISRARELLGWSPKVELDEALLRTVDHFRDILRTDDTGQILTATRSA